ncbi:hypothetical protein [Streptomyces albidoflavus]|uniref:hypothetical protein n=1 Tax=Streptomyces albidoflavus TaxID=1886 RepID=UPI00101E74B5|nr:hypothetical protein [Streptomyces albidoflavus]RZD83967.1 hypothetical protein C0Q63_19150 [Streptomyces albidoflavus]
MKKIQVTAVAVASAVTYSVTAQLMGTDLSFAVVFACSTAVFTAVLNAGLMLAGALSTSSFRCPHCTFTVRVQHTDAGETRRWQEITADHPRHLGDSRA